MSTLLREFESTWRKQQLKKLAYCLLFASAAVALGFWLDERSRRVAATPREALLFLLLIGVAAISFLASIAILVDLKIGPRRATRTVDGTVIAFLDAVLTDSRHVDGDVDASAIAYLDSSAAAEFSDWGDFETYWKAENDRLREWLQPRCSNLPMTTLKYTIDPDIEVADDLRDRTTVQPRVHCEVWSEGALLERSCGPWPIVVEVPLARTSGLWYVASARLRWKPAAEGLSERQDDDSRQPSSEVNTPSDLTGKESRMVGTSRVDLAGQATRRRVNSVSGSAGICVCSRCRTRVLPTAGSDLCPACGQPLSSDSMKLRDS